MKNFLCFTLVFLLSFNAVSMYVVWGETNVDDFKQELINSGMWEEGSDGYLKPKDTGLDKIRKFIEQGLSVPKLVGSGAEELSNLLLSLIGNNSDNIKCDGHNVYFTGDFVTNINTALQDKVHALDGYYLLESDYPFSWDTWENTVYELTGKTADMNNISSTVRDDVVKAFNTLSFVFYDPEYGSSAKFVFPDYSSSHFNNFCLASDASGDVELYDPTTKYSLIYWSGASGPFIRREWQVSYFPPVSEILERKRSGQLKVCGAPVKIFYSYEDADNYYSKGRTYVPKLPSGGFKVNIKYINNAVSLPDITYNITTENKTETEIQNQYDTTINNYLNGLDDFTDGGGGSTTNPTPTPSGGGGFDDGTTPTPEPDFTDGSLNDTGTLLQKILDKLTEFDASHDKLAKTITDYIEKNDGKLEEILIAIQALTDGKTEIEQNGCKYDFTALSEYLTDLWNNSDQKFDEMVKLLEENNKYQEKLVDSLNEIKALLIADTVMDFFKDRSQETAEKAKDKFPTSIPWDISLVLNSMSAEPQNPKFSLPIKIESFKINETIDIDLSTEEWEKLAKTCRYILSVTFILFLIHLSRKLFLNGGDD